MPGFPDAVASTTVASSPTRVWAALTDPEQIAQYFFGTRVVTDWQVGGPITWSGEWQGHRYEDRGRVLEVDPPVQLAVTHYSPLTGLPDVPENYHTVTWTLTLESGGTEVTIRQGNNRSEADVAESEKTWNMVLAELKLFLSEEGRGSD
ncbi:SRPBCC family protein [Nocardia stercoris]|uniref:SRPBCC domain-containing protein n=1 Tax=Nocardia stercoris TaxID=2483361 RepID=A0A3M2L6L7_9NOCA|nr:SRPBCC domain-containing protein [Nocardia stercoris]RMI32636.1 SRPBCC domain-containing protein [Nocardia stercoris]